MKTLQDKIALVTGGTSGIGRATAIAYARAGAKVVVSGRREQEGKETVALIEKAGGTGLFVRADVAKEADVKNLVEATLRSAKLASVFQATASPGLAELLTGAATMRDVVRPEVAAGVDLIPAGVSADPFWTFTGDKLRTTLNQVLENHDLCLVDVPGLNRAPEASFVVRALDAVVLVVETNRHREAVVRRNLTYLRSLGTPVLGSVANQLVHEVPALVHKLM